MTLLLSIEFTTSQSRIFPVALDIARQAVEFNDEPHGKIKKYEAKFGATPQQAELAIALLQHLDNIKGVTIRAGGRLIVNQGAVIETLGCFVSAQAGGGVEEYCQQTIEMTTPKVIVAGIQVNALDDSEPIRYLHPCTKLLRAGFRPDTASKNTAQKILATAAHEGCDWCPNFNATDWRKTK